MYAVLHIVESFASIIFNGVVLLTLAKFSIFHTNSFKILAALSLSQFLFGVSTALLTMISLFGDIQVILLAQKSFTPLFIVISANTLAFYAFDRCIQIITESHYQIQQKTLNIVIVLSYVIPGFTYLLRLLDDNDVTYLLIANIEGALMFVIIVFIFGAVLTSLNQYTNTAGNSMHDDYVKNTREARIVLVVIAFFILLNLPCIVHLSHSGAGNGTPAGHFLMASMAAAVAIPFIAICGNLLLRNHVYKLLGVKRRHRVETSTST